jgi:hypothetical protein
VLRFVEFRRRRFFLAVLSKGAGFGADKIQQQKSVRAERRMDSAGRGGTADLAGRGFGTKVHDRDGKFF